MLNLRRFLKGDTLIEVTIAIGIFALVAISVVAVVSISTSGAQLSLENTLTREEVDAQAETIRFLQGIIDANDATIDGTYCDAAQFPDTKDGLYQAMWCKLKSLAEDNVKYGINDSLISFNSDTCKTIYDDDDTTLVDQNAFIIDLKKLNAYADGQDAKDWTDEVIRVVKENDNRKYFTQAFTYPQLVYDQSENDSLLGGSNLQNKKLESVEGIYIVGVQDPTSTNVISQDQETGEVKVESKPAYYDFYVRSCWYNSGSENPSSISTAVRVHDPDAIAHIDVNQAPPEDPEPPEITFENIEWKKYGDQQYGGHLSPCNGVMPEFYDDGIYNNHTTCEPVAGQHITFPDNVSIQLIGSTRDGVSLGAYYDKFNANEAFSLQTDVDASNIGTHPSENGAFTITLSIVNDSGSPAIPMNIVASIGASKQSISISGAGGSTIDMSAKKFNLLLEYNRGRFKACVTEPDKGQQCISATAQIPANSFLKVDFNLRHGSHNCYLNAIVKLFNIQMRRATTGTITF